MLNEYKLYFYRHKPFVVLPILILLGCFLQNAILSGENMGMVQDTISVESTSLIFQNFAIDTIIFMSLIYYIFCAASSIINDRKNGVFIYPSVKNIHPVKIVIKKVIASYLFLLTCNALVISMVSIVTIFLYGGHQDLLLNGLILIMTKSYTGIFYITLSLLFALLVNNYVLVLSVLFLVEISKIGMYAFFNKLAVSKYIILNHIDISSFFNLPSTAIDRGYTFLFSVAIYIIYLLIMQMLIFYTFCKKRRGLI